jgi:pimeloyl-ACP methyl ester carboxylesterase
MTKNLAHEIKLENDVTIYTESYGDKADKPILLLHGAGNSMLNWSEDFCEKLSNEGFYVIRMDSRDAGRSKKYPLGNPGYGLMDLARDVIGVLDNLHIQKINLVGVSQGAAITQLLAIHYPARVASICLISATPGGPGHATGDLPSMTSEIAALFSGPGPSDPDWSSEEEVVNYLVEAERPFSGSAFDEELTRHMATDTFNLVPELANQLTNPYMIDAGDPWRKRLAEIGVPTLIVHGSEDPLFPLEHGKALAKEIPHANLLVIDGMGHANMPRSAQGVLIENIKELIKKTA